MDSLEQFITRTIADNSSATAVFDPKQGFWQAQPQFNFPPPVIRDISDCQHSDRLALACTQTSLPASQQKQLVNAWCEHLPRLQHIRFLWIESILTQPLFEAICRMPALQGLYIKWGKLTDATALQQLRQLRFLHIGSAPRLQPLDVLAKLPELQWLELENVQAATDTAFLLPLKGLRGLSLQGPLNGGKPLALKSLQALTALQQLEWLDLGNLTLADQSLTVIAELPTLRHLHLCNRFAMEQLAALAGKRPDLDCPRLQPHSDPVEWTLCRYCGQPRMVMLTGKGKPWLCLDCDSQRLHQHCQQFAKLAQQAAGAAHNRCQDQSFPA